MNSSITTNSPVTKSKKCKNEYSLENISKKDYKPDFIQARKEVLQEASKEYYAALHDYVNKYQMYLNGDTSQKTQNQILRANQRLIDINKKLQSNNEETSADIRDLYDNHKSIVDDTLREESKEIETIEEATKQKTVDYEALQQQISQLKKSFRRQNLISFVYVVFILILVYSLYFMYGMMFKTNTTV